MRPDVKTAVSGMQIAGAQIRSRSNTENSPGPADLFWI
jgi:hypothetical protein